MATIILSIINIANPDKKQVFLNRLTEVELKHIEWFKNRPAIFDGQEHDSIKNHTFSEGDDANFSFSFWKHSELPANIKTECLQAYQDVFGQKNVA